MLLIFNIIIASLSIIPIIIIIINPSIIHKNHFKNHAIIFIIKILFISMFIYFFINNFKGSDFKVFIISGYTNLALFHIIEGFFIQKIIKKNDIRQ